MSLSIIPGFTYQVNATSVPPVKPLPVQPQRREAVVAEVEPEVERSVRRSEDYVVALRELRADQQNPRQHLATRTYLQVAHYEGNFQLVDVYT